MMAQHRSLAARYGAETLSTMTERTTTDERNLRRFWVVIALAATATLVAALAGLVLGIADPDDGSGSEPAWTAQSSIQTPIRDI